MYQKHWLSPVHEHVIRCPVKSGIKLFIHSQISMVQTLKFGNGPRKLTEYVLTYPCFGWIPSKAPVHLMFLGCFWSSKNVTFNRNCVTQLQDSWTHFLRSRMHTSLTVQKTIVNHVLNETYAAHDALADCQALEKAMAAADHHLKESRIDNFKYTFTSGTMVGKLRCDELKTQNLLSLKPPVIQKQLSIKMAEKAASSGLQMRHSELAFHRNEDKGINRLFAENGAGKPRVTKDKKISRRVSWVFQITNGKLNTPNIPMP